MSRIKVRLIKNNIVNVRLKPQNGIKVRTDTTYLYDPTLIEGAVALAEDWAIKTDGLVEEEGVGIDYSAKAYAIGGTGTTTNNAKYYAEQASNSATSASDSATTATTQAGIATTQAGIATTQAGTATTQAGIATIKAGEASTSATNAHTSEVNAGNYASSALTSATNASTSETNAQIWAEGTDIQVATLGGEKSSRGWAIRAKQIVESIGSVLRYKGSVATRADLPSSGQEIGDMYNILSDGSNVVWNGTEWDDISGIVDLTGYATEQWVGQQGFLTSTALNGYATEQWVGQQGYITGITSSDVTTALGYTPYNSSNPNGYQENVLEGVQVNGTDLTITNKKVNVSVPTQASDINAQPTLVSGTNIKTVNSNSLLGSGDLVISGLPSQTSQSGKFLTTDGTSASWDNIPAEIPSQTGNSGKYLTTNGTSVSWGEIAEYTAQEVETLWGSL